MSNIEKALKKLWDSWINTDCHGLVGRCGDCTECKEFDDAMKAAYKELRELQRLHRVVKEFIEDNDVTDSGEMTQFVTDDSYGYTLLSFLEELGSIVGYKEAKDD